jgi:diadenosine tetraphosphate (Ap4A) HIT family hydrolase
MPPHVVVAIAVVAKHVLSGLRLHWHWIGRTEGEEAGEQQGAAAVQQTERASERQREFR